MGLLTAETTPVTVPDRPERIRYRRPTVNDGAAVWRLVRESNLDDNSPYAYVLWGDAFASTSRVAVDEADQPVGFVMGLRLPDRPDSLFIWQIGVDQGVRGRGVASQLLDGLWGDVTDIRFLESTVTPSNEASDRLFRSFATRHGGELERSLAYGEDLFPDGGHEAEYRYRIGPIAHGR